jgi:prolyl 4-hydroxylase
MIPIADPDNIGGGEDLVNAIWEVAQAEVEDWTGIQMRSSSVYGIRVYTNGSVLNPHVDRLPLVSSCIVNVAQDVDEDWPLEVYDRFGEAVNVTMRPGDMVFYESHSLVHGRPFPLKGRHYANIFIHFEAMGESLYDEGQEPYDKNGELPPYILPNSPEAEYWLTAHPTGWSKVGFTEILDSFWIPQIE